MSSRVGGGNYGSPNASTAGGGYVPSGVGPSIEGGMSINNGITTFAPVGTNPNQQAPYNSFLPNYGSAGSIPMPQAQSPMNPAGGTMQQRRMQQLPQYSGFYSQAQ